MARNKVQFQKEVSLNDFIKQYPYRQKQHLHRGKREQHLQHR